MKPHPPAGLLSDVPVLDGLDRTDQFSFNPGFLPDLANGCGLGRLAGIDQPLGKLPPRCAALSSIDEVLDAIFADGDSGGSGTASLFDALLHA